MDKIRVRGGKKISGTLEVGGSKNAALPILFSSLLTEDACTYTRVPDLQDIKSTLALLSELGAQCDDQLVRNEVTVQATILKSHEAPYDIVRKMRASVLVLGPLLARFGEAKVSLPGGCAIGARPIDFHLKAFEAMGAQITLEGGYVLAKTSRLHGARIQFPMPSVGATENVMMAASLAEGQTVIENAAREPEIVDLAQALRSMGAKISGEGTATMTIDGVSRLHGARHSVIPDRIQAGTYLAAAFMTGGTLTLTRVNPKEMESTLDVFRKMGADIQAGGDSIRLGSRGRPKAVHVTTEPHPGFPTDMQAQVMAVASIADGESIFTETIFENRFMHVPELARMGADIRLDGNRAMVHGVAELRGAPVMATDLRASACLVLAGLVAKGETVVNRIYHLDRGYERMVENLATLGADIERIK